MLTQGGLAFVVCGDIMSKSKVKGHNCGGSAAILARSSKMTNNTNTMSRKERRKAEHMLNKLWDITLNNPKHGICCICGKPYNNHGNNARPFMDGRCCNECDIKYVRPYRISHYDEYQAQIEQAFKAVSENIARYGSFIR